MTLAEMWREEGLEEGVKIGGERELIDMATRILVQKFKKVPTDIKESIHRLDASTLRVLIMKIIEFDELDEIREYL